MFTPGSRACAYKTASGRAEWPNRDPIGEFGGPNLYGFVGNRSTTYVDTDGRFAFFPVIGGPLGLVGGPGLIALHHYKQLQRNPQKVKLPIKKNTITVNKCQVVVFLTHFSKRHPWAFNVPNPSCSGVGYVGCSPGTVLPSIPQQARLPGIPTHNDKISGASFEALESFNTMNVARDSYEEMLPEAAEDPANYHASTILGNLEKAAEKRANEICKKGCCSQVEIIVHNHKLPANDPSGATDFPATYRLTISCKAQRKIAPTE